MHFGWPRASLRAYLVSIILLATVPVAALLVPYQLFSSAEAQRSRLDSEMRLGSAALAAAIDREIASSVDALGVLSLVPFTDAHRAAVALQQRLLSGSRTRRVWSSVFLATTDGRLLYSTAAADGPLTAAFLALPAVRDAALSDEPIVSDFVRGPQGNYQTAVAVTLDFKGAGRRMVGAWIAAPTWQSLLVEGVLPPNASAALFDRRDSTIAQTVDPQSTVGSALLPSIVKAKNGRPAGEAQIDVRDGVTGRVVWDQVGRTGWGVTVSLETAPLDQASLWTMLAPLAAATGCLLLGIVLALFVARRVTAPLAELAAQRTDLPPARIPVREVEILRNTLAAARSQDQRARELLLKKADEFETLFNSSPIGLAFAQDPECRSVVLNAAMKRRLGHRGAEADVRTLHGGVLLAPEQQPLQRAAAFGEPTDSLELELAIDGQRPIFVLASAAPLLDADGRPRGAIAAAVDITERRESEARLLSIDHRLRESQRLVDLAQQAGHVGFFYYSFDQDLLGWTPGLAHLFEVEGNDSDAASLEMWAQRIGPAARLRVEGLLDRMVNERNETETIDLAVVLEGGRSRWLSNRLRMTYDANGQPVQLVGITVDMSDQKQAERERDTLLAREQSARQEAEAANSAKDEFLAMLGHELRNPLSAISSAVEVLDRTPSDSEVSLNARSIIGRQTRNLARLMDDLLDVARVISGKIILSRQPFDLAALVERLMSTLTATDALGLHQVKLDLQPAWINGDPTRIEQVVSNLVGNAVKYTPAGGGIEVAVHQSNDEEVLLEVRDTGVGIPSALLPHVFELFVQGERTLDRRAGGLGIGLTLVKKLVGLHNGNIEVASSSKGTEFRVCLPAVSAPASRPLPVAQRSNKRFDVLIVEDNEDALLALQTILELMGHSVTAEPDGHGGLARLLGERPEIAIVDIGLPGLTGLDVAKRARGGGYAGRMIAVSGYGQASDIRQAMVSGFDAYLVKPIDTAELDRLMREE